MQHLCTWLVTTLALIVLGAGCEADRPNAMDKPDASVGEALRAPQLMDIPMSTPNDTVAVRGSTNGTRVVATGGIGDPMVRPVLPSGSFCVDVPIETGETMLQAYALKDGLISPAAFVTVTRDVNAPIPQSPKCLGQEQPVCVAEDSASSNCANDKDEDCDGFTDECDTGCNGCVEDGFGPNWEPFYVPMIAPGTYTGMKICPCRDDWYAFQVQMGRTIRVKATFSTVDIDIDMILQTPMAAQDGLTTSVAASRTTTGIEEITWVATESGIFYLKVYSYRDGGDGTYTLQVFP